MDVGERERRELQEALVGTIGPDPTDTLLGYLPAGDWSEVATKRDLDALDSKFDGRIGRLEGRIDAVEGRLSGRIDAIGGRIEGLEGRIDGLDHKIDSMSSHLEGQLHHELHHQTRWLVGMTITVVLSLFADVLALTVQGLFR